MKWNVFRYSILVRLSACIVFLLAIAIFLKMHCRMPVPHALRKGAPAGSGCRARMTGKVEGFASRLASATRYCRS